MTSNASLSPQYGALGRWSQTGVGGARPNDGILRRPLPDAGLNGGQNLILIPLAHGFTARSLSQKTSRLRHIPGESRFNSP